jgi:single-stranded-DNA-specific exonuclease
MLMVDADGATSCAVMLRSLKAFGLDNVDYLVPNRFDFGYGLSPEIVDVAADVADPLRPDLIVTVDNGISSITGVQRAAELGIPVVVTDHHLAGRELPAAAAIVNPGCGDS